MLHHLTGASHDYPDACPDGQVAVVTGGGRSIGKMITRGLLEAGAKVYISSRKDADLESAVEELSPLGEVHTVPASLGTAHGVEAGRLPR
ncbi:SDR family NAD(P)-dependent oxidoreductase [Streptomyces sp. NPDC001443]